MEQTIRQRRFGSLSTRRKQRDQEANTIYQSMNKTLAPSKTSKGAEVETSNTDSTTSSLRSSPEINASTSVETLSDMSVTTPSGIPIMISDLRKENETKDTLFKTRELNLTIPPVPKEMVSSSPRPVLAPSLRKPSDFSFDRYSSIIESADLDDIEIFEVSEAACSPLKVATPITYIRPNRPSMVSIFNILDKDSSKESKQPLSARPDVPARNPERTLVNKRVSTISTRSGFVAGEATPFQVPDLPDNALTMISNASQTEIPTLSRSQEPILKRQKSGINLLTKAIKYGHSRMTSRAYSISPSPAQSRPQSQHGILASMPSGATSRLPATAKPPPTPSGPPQPPPLPHASSNFTHPRPQTAAPSTASQPPAGVTALPLYNESLSQRKTPMTGNSSHFMGHTSRKKSMSALRSRGDSIGNALMAMTRKSSVGRSKGRNIAREALGSPGVPTEPPRPVLFNSNSANSSVDLNAFPAPPEPERPKSNRGGVVSFSRPLRSSSMPLQGFGVTVN